HSAILTFIHRTWIVWYAGELAFQGRTLRVRFALPLATRSAQDASRRRRAFSAMRSQSLRQSRRKRWKRVAEGIWRARCRSWDTGLLESGNSIHIRGMKTWATKRCGVVKRPTIHRRGKATTATHG